MKTLERKSFQDEAAFRLFASRVPLLYFHVFETTPNEQVLLALQSCGEGEKVILLDITEDSGFLAQTQVTVEITQVHQFISKPLSQVCGVGAWAKGTLVDFVQDTNGIPELMHKARRFAIPPVGNIT